MPTENNTGVLSVFTESFVIWLGVIRTERLKVWLPTISTRPLRTLPQNSRKNLSRKNVRKVLTI